MSVEENDQLQDRSKYDMHEGIAFVIELTDTLLFPDPLTGQSHLEVILEAIQEAMAHSVITLPNTGYGVYLFNGEKTTAGLKTGIERLFDVQDLNPSSMKIIHDILEENQFKSDDDPRPYIPLSERFKPSYSPTSENPLDDVLRVVQDDFLTKKDFQKLYTNKKIFLFTDNDHPIDKNNSIQKNILRNTCMNLDDSYITISPYFIATEHKPFNDQLYSELMLTSRGLNHYTESDDVDLEDELFDGPNTKPIDVKYIRERILSKKEIKRKQLETTLILSEGIKIGIRGYSVYSHEKARRSKYLYETGTLRKNVYNRRRLVNPSTGEEFEETTRVYKAGPRDSDIVELSDEQAAELGKYDENHDTFLRLLGFKDELSGIKLHYNVTTSSFIVPDEDLVEGSTRTLAALYKSLTKSKKVAILFGKVRKASQPFYFSLQPTRKPFSEGFFLIRLPFLDDIRKIPDGYGDGVLSDEVKTDVQLRKITSLILSRLKLKNGYKPSEFKNPTLQQHYRILHDYLLQVEQDPNEDRAERMLKNDDTLSKIQVIRGLVEKSQYENDGRLFAYIKEWNRLQRES